MGRRDQQVGDHVAMDLEALDAWIENLMEEGMGNVDLDKELAKYRDVLTLPVTELMTRNPAPPSVPG